MLKKPTPLTKKINLSKFDSGNKSLDSWLIKHAQQASGSGSAKTFIVLDNEKPVGFYSLTVGSAEANEVPERVAKGMGNYPIPVIILARIAVVKDYQGRGLGSGMLKDSIMRSLSVSNEIGIRAMLTHPVDDKADSFYKYFGFVECPLRPRQLVILLKDAKKLLA